MTVGVMLTARLGSTRLEKKHLRRINGRPAIDYLIQRVRRCFGAEIEADETRVILATAARQENEELREFEPEVKVFFGDEGNIPLRHYQAAMTFGLSGMVSVDGDDILCAPRAMRAVYDALKSGSSLAVTEGLPIGLNAWGYSTEALRSALGRARTDQLDTGWGRIFEDRDQDIIEFSDVPEMEDMLRFTLDYEADLEFFRAVIGGLGADAEQLDDRQLVEFVLEEELHRINSSVIQKYRERFEAEQKVQRARD